MMLLRGLMALYGASGHTRRFVSSLGILLQSNKSLVEAMSVMGHSSSPSRARRACQNAVRMLSEGTELIEVIKTAEMRVFPRYVRIIMAAPIPDKIKGRLLVDWRDREESNIVIIARFMFPWIAFFMSIPATISLFIFVLPQFIEISRGLEIGFSPFTAFVVRFISLGDIAILGYMAIVLTSIVAFVAFSVVIQKKIRETIFDEIDLYKILAVTEPEHRVKVMKILAIPQIFPRLHSKIKVLLLRLEQGANLQHAFKLADFDTFQQWFVTLAFNGEADEQLLLQAADMVESRAETIFTLVSDVITVLTIVVQGVIIGGAVFACMQFIADIMAASFI